MQSELLNPIVADRQQKCLDNALAIDFDTKKIKGYTTAGQIKKSSKSRLSLNAAEPVLPSLKDSTSNLHKVMARQLNSPGSLSFSVLASPQKLNSENEDSPLLSSFQDVLKEMGVDYVGI